MIIADPGEVVTVKNCSLMLALPVLRAQSCQSTFGPQAAIASDRMNDSFVRISDIALLISLRQARTSGLGTLQGSAPQRPSDRKGPKL